MLKTKIFDHINEIPISLWNDLAHAQSCAFSHEFWQVIEHSALNDFQYRHVVFYNKNNKPVGLTSFYSVTTDVAIFAPAGLRNILGKIRQVFPNFLKFRMLECGTPLTVSSPPFISDGSVSTAELVATLDLLLQQVAKAEGQIFIIIRDFDLNTPAPSQELVKRGYHMLDSLPNTHMEIRWNTIEDYRAALKSYYRSKLLKHLRINEKNNIRHELCSNFDHLAETLCKQWLVVHNQADECQREVLTPAFFREFSVRMGDRTKTILFYRGDELIGHALLLLDGEMLRWMYFGRNQAGNDSLYLYVGHAVIESAILLGAKRLELGLTTYSIKQDLGAQVSPLKLALRSSFGIINPLISRFYPLLNRPASLTNKNVFKSAE